MAVRSLFGLRTPLYSTIEDPKEFLFIWVIAINVYSISNYNLIP